MPHVVLNGKVNCEKVFSILEDLFMKLDKGIIKTANSFIDKNKQSILIESLAIEEGKKIEFLALINNRDDGVVVRLYPLLDVEKTDGVKRTLAEIAKQILKKIEKLEVGKTNLQDFL